MGPSGSLHDLLRKCMGSHEMLTVHIVAIHYTFRECLAYSYSLVQFVHYASLNLICAQRTAVKISLPGIFPKNKNEQEAANPCIERFHRKIGEVPGTLTVVDGLVDLRQQTQIGRHA